MTLTIQIVAADGTVKQQASARQSVYMVYQHAYQPGDTLVLEASEPGYVVAQLEDSIQPAFGWLNGRYTQQVPFDEKRVCHSPKSFTGSVHLLRARTATPAEQQAYRNLALNPMDCHENTGLYPHASANVETRGESVFAARNAINGNTANAGHGPWPYESWGINQQADAEITIDFGREVILDAAVITLRADFPHDNWWKEATLTFSDGSTFVPQFTKTAQPQEFSFAARAVTWVKMDQMKKDETDPSPFPALAQLELWGYNKGE
ncbi:discoidin domain-containing protein [Ruminococcaceae bacterium OttesenSCG-928-A16]|nr:discoidin domain-containing protein [Ruminococcaceae bacterium OttesenSCG-928-A16]